MTLYVVGFMLSPSMDRVALIRKSKPEWQAGLLNGIGGKVEANEAYPEAMVREFMEETGVETEHAKWTHYAVLNGDDWCVQMFACCGELEGLETMEEEPVEIWDVSDVVDGSAECIENVPWLLNLAIDVLVDGRPSFVHVQYP